jgi:hypothetical protein
VTPTYQTRPVCVAELGAAWSRAGRLMPFMVPGMPRTNLEGVLAGMTIRALDDSSTLDELHDRVKEATGVSVKAATWNRHKQRWLKALPNLVETVPVPETVSPADVEQLRQDLEGAREALDEVEEENARLRRDLEAVSKLKDATEVAVARLPDDENKRFEALVADVKSALKPLNGVLEEAIWADRFVSGLQRPPEWEEPLRAQFADDGVKDGFLYEDDDGMLHPDTSSGAMLRAQEQVGRLQSFLTEECSEEFFLWFKEEYDFEPDVRKKRVWDQLF